MKYEIKRSKRKTMSIQVYRDNRIVVRVPSRCKNKDIEFFVNKHKGWIQIKFQESLQYPGLSDSDYSDGGNLWLEGVSLSIKVGEADKNRIIQTENQLEILQKDSSDSVKTLNLISQWKRDYAAELFQKQLAYWVTQFPIQLKDYSFKLRKMKRQWGNCNHKGVITINSQLIRYPLKCIDYVIVHELTHLKHLHHGRAFYTLLETVMPDWQQHKKLLSQFSGLNPHTE